MDHSDKELAIIILRSTYTSLTQDEQEKLSAYLNAAEANRAKYQELIDAEQLKQKMAHYANRNQNEALHLQTILQRINKKTRIYPFNFFKRYWLAAAVLLLAAGAWWINEVVTQKEATTATIAAMPQKEVVPGKEGAVLTLDDGSQLVLDSISNGMLTTQQGAHIILKDGQLAYDKTAAGKDRLIYNTLATPKGREFKLALPDGTQVWLNSGSSIRYPVNFPSNERLVCVTGEVYFEVATVMSGDGSRERNRKIPFIVKINSPAGDAGTVEVLGTHFNVNAYDAICRTTLLEGKVIVKAEGSDSQAEGKKQKAAVVLKPGQQASVSNASHSSQTITVQTADIDKTMAWRRGYFNFENADLNEVMQQLARWYDIAVEYEAGVPNIQFAGELSRGMKWSSVLQALEDSKVHFKTTGRKIIILP